MEEVTLEQRQELGKKRRQERGQHLQENHPPELGLHPQGYKGHRATQGSLLGRGGVVDVPFL